MTLLEVEREIRRCNMISETLYLRVSVAALTSCLANRCVPFVLADSSCCDKHLFDFVDENWSGLRRDDAVELSPC